MKFLQEINVGICGSEIVGLVPLKSMLSAADYYIKKENLFILDEKQKVRLVLWFSLLILNCPQYL